MKINKIFIWPTKQLLNLFVFWAVVGLSSFILFFIITSTWIGFSVKDQCQVAVEKYQSNNCVEGLIGFLEDETNPIKTRSQAVWALGQMGDKKALPVLEKYYDGSDCDHEHKLCQYELKKAINLVSGGFNATAFIWRHQIN